MMHKNRSNRISPLRRTLTVEALEERTLLTGNVLASLNATTGLLTITGDSGNNQFALAPASDNTGALRITGTATTINGATTADFTLAQVKAITMVLAGGLDNVTLTGFSIPGQVTITYGNPQDVFATSNFSAAAITQVLVNTGTSVTSGTNGSGNTTGLLVGNQAGPASGGTGGALGGAVGGGASGTTGSTNNGGLPRR
jgi:hypothetical protein